MISSCVNNCSVITTALICILGIFKVRSPTPTGERTRRIFRGRTRATSSARNGWRSHTAIYTAAVCLCSQEEQCLTQSLGLGNVDCNSLILGSISHLYLYTVWPLSSRWVELWKWGPNRAFLLYIHFNLITIMAQYLRVPGESLFAHVFWYSKSLIN